MNLVILKRLELSPQGKAIPDSVAQKHFYETLQLEDRDFIHVGVWNGQKGIGQVHIIDKVVDKKSITPIYMIQLLPLSVKTTDEARDMCNIKLDVTRSLEVRNSGARPKISIENRVDIPTFPSLNESEMNNWCVNPLQVNYKTCLSTFDPFLPGSAIPSNYLSKSVELSSANLPKIDLFIALPRPKLLEKLLQYVASMSIGRVHFFASSRSDLAYFSSPKLSVANITKHLKLGLEQGMKTVPPDVIIKASLKEALAQCSPESIAILAHPYTVQGQAPICLLDDPVMKRASRASIIIGPEGGFTEEETNIIYASLSKECHVSLVSLGQDILRCEVALLVLIGQASLLLSKNEPTTCGSQIIEEAILSPGISLPIKGRQ